MKNVNKKQAIKIITDAAKKYDELLNKKHFLIIYQTKRNIEYVKIDFRSQYFLHLTGVETSLSAKVFYSSCLNNRLSEQNIKLQTHGHTQRKLFVLPYLHELLFNHCMIGASLNNGIRIDTDYFIGNTKTVLSLGFRDVNNIDSGDIPVSLYYENIKKLTKPTYKVLGIFSKMHYEDKFNVCTYSSGLEELQLPEDIKDMIALNE